MSKRSVDRIPQQQDIDDACLVLANLVHDLIGAHQFYEMFANTIAKFPPIKQQMLEIEVPIRRMYFSMLLLTLCKVCEFYERYKWLLPEKAKKSYGEVYKELNHRRIKNVRDKFIGHIWNWDTGRPLSEPEIDRAFNTAVGSDLVAFLNWVYVWEADVRPGTVVGVLQAAEMELRAAP